MDDITINIDRLREDLASFYRAGAYCGMPAMILEAADIEHMSDEELISKALDEGIDLSEYQI